MRYLLILFALLAIQAPAFMNTLYVPDDYTAIQDAIDAAATGDTLIVRPGTYVEKIDLKGKAITLQAELGSAVTVIDGNQTGTVVTCQNGEGVDTTLEGFTIRNGAHAYGGGMYNFESSPTVTRCVFSYNMGGMVYGGGGMCNRYSSPVLTECVFTGNWSDTLAGGGMSNWESSPTLIDCTFIGNWAKLEGGGMFNHDSIGVTVMGCSFFGNSADNLGGGMCNSKSSTIVTECIFLHNEAFFGGGISNAFGSPVISGCIFSRNTADVNGGGMRSNSSEVTVTDCTFFGNMAEHDGGGMEISACSPVVAACTFLQNSADRGGAIFNGHEGNTTAINCIFSENRSNEGGGIFNSEASPVISSCTFFENLAFLSGGGMWNYHDCSTTVTNTVFWNNHAPVGPELCIGSISNPSTLFINHSDVEGGQAAVHVETGCTLQWGIGMIDDDPLFVDPVSGDFHLTYSSPCRDSGDNHAVLKVNDFEGDPRIAWEGTTDMGADEFYNHIYCTGDFIPEGDILGNFIGLPDTWPVGLFLGSGIMGTPLQHQWGLFHLEAPWILIPLIPLPAEGVLSIQATLPPTSAPYEIPMQALIGWELSNLFVVEIE